MHTQNLDQVPDHRTLNRTFQHLSIATWRTLFRCPLATLHVREPIIAGNSTGFRLSHASAYFQTRSGRTFHDWFRGAYAVGIASQVILAAHRAHGGNPNDARFLKPLHRDAAQCARTNCLCLGDAGFDCWRVSQRDIIPPIRRNGRLELDQWRARADVAAPARLVAVYGQRCKCETVHSVIKRLFLWLCKVASQLSKH